MQIVSAAIIRFASALSTPAGFLLVMATLAAGGALVWVSGASDTAQLAFNLYLSVLAIIIGCAILVASARDTAAVHLKLDELIIASEATNRAVGIERRPAEEIEAERKRAEAGLGDRDADHGGTGDRLADRGDVHRDRRYDLHPGPRIRS